MRVWIVDDSSLQAEVSRRALAPQYEVRVFQSGAEALEALSSDRPGVLVLDWHMPDLSGVEVCKFVRHTLNLAELPILILTATTTRDSLLEALDAGANDFVRKPFVDAELNARVAALARLTELHGKLALAEKALRVEADFRERFMGMLAHDLRQPLNAVFMASDALSNAGVIPEPYSGFLHMQRRAAERMKRMIAELLDFTRSRPESGMPIERRGIDLVDLVRTSVEEMQLGRRDDRLNFTSEGACTGMWDPDRIAQVCSNLVGNAFEHGAPDTTVDVSVTCKVSHVELSVSSRGAVIPEDVLTTLFQPFRRARSPRKGSSGVGLGLHIVDEIVRAHGGTVTVVSARGITCFSVSLPRDVPDDFSAEGP